jgi:pyrroline-5-carboxylate reductase
VSYTYRLGIIGAGAMGAALARGVVTGGELSPGQIIVSDVQAGLLAPLGEVGLATSLDSQQLAQQAETVLLAVKPQVLATVAKSLSLQADQLVISIVAGVTLAHLGELLGEQQPVIRVMPNILAGVSASASAYVGNAAATEAHLELAQRLLSSVGTAVRVEEKPGLRRGLCRGDD